MTRFPRRSRLLLLNAAIALGTIGGGHVVDSGNAAAAAWRQRAPWCAYLGGMGGGFECAYYTFEQCMETARGLGGYRSPNPYAVVDNPNRTRRRARR
jgi:Protein of unknown function (DUF3551)